MRCDMPPLFSFIKRIIRKNLKPVFLWQEDAIKAEKKPTYSRENWRPAQVVDGSDE